MKLKDLSGSFKRLAKIETEIRELLDKQDAEAKRISAEGRKVVLAAIKKAGWVRGETLLAYRERGWAVGIYQGTSMPHPPMKSGDKWSMRIHTLSVLKDGKPGKAKGVEWVAVDDPAMICDGFKIVGKIVPAKVVHP